MVVRPGREEFEKGVQELDEGDLRLRRPEEALREIEENIRILFENVNDALFIVQDERIIFINPKAEEMSGYSKEECAKISFPDLIHPEDRGRGLEPEKTRQTGEGFQGADSCRMINKSGNQLWIQLNTASINWEGHPATLYLIRNRTLQRELEARLRQAEKLEAIGRWAGGIAHDLNNILMPLLLNAEMALEDLHKDDELSFNLKEVLKAGHRARDLVKQIITFSRASEEHTLPLAIIPIIKETIKFFRSSLPSTIEIQQHIEVPQELDSVKANPMQIHQVLMNLCTHAYHALRDKGGVLEVRLVNIAIASDQDLPVSDLTPGKYLKLTVSDTGHGMDSEVMEQIFDPCFSNKRNSTGTDPGLSRVKSIMKDLNGTVAVSSEFGKGTIFDVFFPYFEKKVFAETEGSGKIPGGHERLLFVEDDEAVVETIQKRLESLGYRVTTRTSGMEGLEDFRKNPGGFDLVLTDQSMPEITGADLAKQVMDIRPDIPVILYTGFSEEIDEKKAREMGISAYVMKPVATSQLAKIIREVLDKTS